LLLDAGEGVAGAITRYLGPDVGAAAVAGLRAVWISHHHPDHMLGVPGLLAARPKGSPPLAVVGPGALR
jgi:ribonuclease Z